MKKPVLNALLEWKGRKLMCNGVCVAEVCNLTLCRAGVVISYWYGAGVERKTEAAARHAVNRRFNLTEVKSRSTT